MKFELVIQSRRRVLIKLLAGVLVLFVSGCATTTQSSRESKSQAQVKRRGYEIIIISEGRAHYFENRLPHCLAYTLAGEWDFAIQEAALRTPDGRGFVGVQIRATDGMPGAPRDDSVSRAVAYYQADTAKDWGRSVPSVVEPFPTSQREGVLLQFDEVTITPETAARVLGSKKLKIGETVRIEKRVIVPFLPGLVMVVTVDDVLYAWQVLDTVQITEHPRCWEPTIRERFPGVLR